jgi:hypothetical protein
LPLTGGTLSAGLTVEGTITAGGNQTRGVLSALADTLTTPLNDDTLSPGLLQLEGRGGYADWNVQPYQSNLVFYDHASSTTSPEMQLTSGGVLSTKDGFTSTKGNTALQNVVEDTTPQLGANLDLNGFEISTTNHGNAGSQSLWGDASTTTGDWSDLPMGFSTFVRNTTANSPTANYGYFTKVSKRDSGGAGWGGLWVGYQADQNYVGRSSDGTSNTWEKLITTSTPNYAQWNTAYGWGDHSTQNYLVSTGDTITGAMHNTSNSTSYLGDGVSNMPLFKYKSGASVGGWARGMMFVNAAASSTHGGMGALGSNDSLTNLAAGFGSTWYNGTNGWKLTSGLLTMNGAITATGNVTGANLNISNWDTAYGWGDHSVENYAYTTGDTITGIYKFTKGDGVRMESVAPGPRWFETGTTTDSGNWWMVADNGTMSFRAYDDAEVGYAEVWRTTRSGTDVTSTFFATGGTTRLTVQDSGIDVNGTIAANDTITIESSTADAALYIKADTDNDTETDNPFVRWEQDANQIYGVMGLVGATNTGPQGNTFTNMINNGLAVRASTAIGLGVLDTAALTIDSNDITTLHGATHFDGGVFMNERSAGVTDVTNYGQIYTKNSSPQELWFVSDDGVEHHVAGGSLSETFGVIKDVTETVTSSTTPQDDDELQLSVTSGVTYHWTLQLEVDRINSGANCGFKWHFDLPASSTGSYSWYYIQTGTSSVTHGASTSLVGDQTISTLPTGARLMINMNGTFTAGGDGTFKFQWAQNTSSLGSARVYLGSALMLVR